MKAEKFVESMTEAELGGALKWFVDLPNNFLSNHQVIGCAVGRIDTDKISTIWALIWGEECIFSIDNFENNWSTQMMNNGNDSGKIEKVLKSATRGGTEVRLLRITWLLHFFLEFDNSFKYFHYVITIYSV